MALITRQVLFKSRNSNLTETGPQSALHRAHPDRAIQYGLKTTITEFFRMKQHHYMNISRKNIKYLN